MEVIFSITSDVIAIRRQRGHASVSSAHRRRAQTEHRGHIMSIQISPFLRKVIAADALLSGGAALVMLLGAPYLAPLTGLPVSLLSWAGLALVPFVALLIVVARRQSASRLTIIDIVAVNALWVAASFGLLLSGYIDPNAFGIAFVAAQALAVAILAELQFIGLRRSAAAA
jgi:hypothetical protein